MNAMRRYPRTCSAHSDAAMTLTHATSCRASRMLRMGRPPNRWRRPASREFFPSPSRTIQCVTNDDTRAHLWTGALPVFVLAIIIFYCRRRGEHKQSPGATPINWPVQVRLCRCKAGKFRESGPVPTPTAACRDMSKRLTNINNVIDLVTAALSSLTAHPLICP